jgi:hypothetical protein
VKRSQINRKTPLERKKPPERKPVERAQSDSRKENALLPKRRAKRKPRPPGEAKAEESARDLVYQRSHGVCEIQLPGVCLGRATNWHHRQGRGQGGEWRASNGLHVCGSGTTGCHGAVTNTNGRRAEYVRNGWIVGRNQDPAKVSAVVWPVGRVFLLDTGSYLHIHPDDIDVPGKLAS